MLFVSFLLTPLRIIISSSIVVAANDIISFFFMAEYYSVCVCVCVCDILIHSSLDGCLRCFHVLATVIVLL